MRGVVLVYRDGGRRVDCARELARLRSGAAATPASADARLALLIEVAEFEAGVADALAPEADSVEPVCEVLREITVHAAHAWLDALEGERADRTAAMGTSERLALLRELPLPRTIELRVSEGYAYYALYPDTYVASARRFADATGVRRAHVIGIRSIGTSLSAVVAAALQRGGCDAATTTVRPRGHPFDRELRIGGDLAARLRRDATLGAHFLIVDEGPGISGSSFAAVVCWLRAAGVAPERIVLFPSWDPDPAALRSRTAQRIWREHSRYCGGSGASSTPTRAFGIDAPSADFSAGRWRQSLAGEPEHWPAAHPQHERWKVFVPSEQRLIRFAGLGHYGTAIETRARTLAGLGIGAQPGALRSGFLDLPFVDGSALVRCESRDDARTIGTYIGRVAAAFPTGAVVDVEGLNDMIQTNLQGIVTIPRLEAAAEVQVAALDGRMLAHEWIRTGNGLVKVDALDHHADHFFPGPQSPAWDLAGAEIELRMDGAQAGEMIGAFAQVAAGADARRWLPFYRVAYAAFRFGYTTLAATTLKGTGDEARFTRAAAYYSQCALKAAACLTASAKSPLKQMARSSMKT